MTQKNRATHDKCVPLSVAGIDRIISLPMTSLIWELHSILDICTMHNADADAGFWRYWRSPRRFVDFLRFVSSPFLFSPSSSISLPQSSALRVMRRDNVTVAGALVARLFVRCRGLAGYYLTIGAETRSN